MKKYLMIFAAMMSVTMSSCTKEQTVDNDPATDPEVPAAGNKSSFTFLKVDQSRIITPKIDVQSYAAVTRSSVSEPAESEYANATSFSSIQYVQNSMDYVKLNNGGTYKIDGDFNGVVGIADDGSGNDITIYIKGVTPTFVYLESNTLSNGARLNIKILSDATLYFGHGGNDGLVHIPCYVTIDCWGEFETTSDTDYKVRGIRVGEGDDVAGGAVLNVYNSDKTFTAKSPEGQYYTDIYWNSFKIDAGCTFYCERIAEIEGCAWISGNAHFANEVHIGKALRLQGTNPVADFDACAYVGGTISNNQGSDNAVINVRNYLECYGIQGIGNKGTCTINLEAATLMVKDPAELPDDQNYYDTWQPVNNRKVSYILRNSFKIVGHTDGTYYSAAYFGDVNSTATLLLYPDEYLSGIDSNNYFTGLSIPEFEGYLNVIAKIEAGHQWNNIGSGRGYVLSVNHIQKGENQENLQINGDTSEFPVHDTCEIDNDGAGVVTPPKHKYSATGIDYDPTTGYMYICWHSNIAGEGEMQDEGQHDHGTNVDPDNDDDDYAGPSVEGKDDWGGIIDILDLKNNTYDPATWIFSTTAIQHEHKYNHVKFHKSKKDNKTRLYLASTSSKVGAALHVVPVNGLDIDIDVEEYRVNLVGGSANCVEVVPDVEGDEHLATISGRTVGGVNWFYIDEDANQTKYYVNKDDTKNFGGKYVCYYNNEVVTLNNTSNATVTVYTIEAGTGKLKEKRRFSTGVKLAPYDGKNAMVVKNDKVYICCGSNGLHVFDYSSGTEVGKFTNFGANCVDVDNDGYIYVATGEGLAVFNPNPDAQKKYELNKYVHYTGTGFAFNENTSGEKLPEGTVKSSSNFVRVIGDNAYVAYGMFGLRIYPLKELRPM